MAHGMLTITQKLQQFTTALYFTGGRLLAMTPVSLPMSRDFNDEVGCCKAWPSYEWKVHSTQDLQHASSLAQCLLCLLLGRLAETLQLGWLLLPSDTALV